MDAMFWPITWLVMACAFICAGGFIVKGCEAMDERIPPKTDIDE